MKQRQRKRVLKLRYLRINRQIWPSPLECSVRKQSPEKPAQTGENRSHPLCPSVCAGRMSFATVLGSSAGRSQQGGTGEARHGGCTIQQTCAGCGQKWRLSSPRSPRKNTTRPSARTARRSKMRRTHDSNASHTLVPGLHRSVRSPFWPRLTIVTAPHPSDFS